MAEEETPLSSRRLSLIIITTGFILLAGFSFVSMASSIAGSTLPLSFTFIVKIGGSNIYQGFVSGGNPVIPLYQESNFSKLMNDDLLSGPFCASGCSMTINPGLYNETQGICDSRNNVAVTGSIASIILPQNTVFGNCRGTAGCVFRAAFCVSGKGQTFTGFKVDDIARDFAVGVSGDVFTITTPSSGGLIQSVTIWNASSNGVSDQGSNYVVTTSTILGPTPFAKSGGNFGVLVGATSVNTRIFLNSIQRFNGSDVSGVQTSNGASFVSITSNDLSQNSFGITSTWGKFLTINGNTIHNNYAGGIALFSGGSGTVNAGPATIAENVVIDNAQEPNNDGQCNNLHCSGIELRATRPSWDTVSLTGNVIKDTQAIHTQLYDIYLLSAQYTNLTITGNSLGPSSSGQTIVLTVNPLASWIISNNPGFNPPAKRSITAGASPFTYTNNDAYMEQLELTNVAGLTSLVCRGDAQVGQINTITPVLNTLDTCVFTWMTTAPTFDVLPLQG